MTLRTQLIEVARRACAPLADSAPLVSQRLLEPIARAGAAPDRNGRPDLYYTLFALAGLDALDAAWPHDAVRAFLLTHAEGSGLDFIHLGALARCWAFLGTDTMPPGLAPALLDRIEAFRKPDGGYDGDPALAHGTAYGAFVALGASQDLGRTPPRLLDLARSLQSLRAGDGAWNNLPNAPVGATNATAGAVVLLRHIGLHPEPQIGDWLLARAHPQGGFLSVPGASLPDLLSTATALHALAALDRRLTSSLHERCLDFVDSLWSAEGGFHGHWADDLFDAEYTFYGLLALGHLSR